MIVNEQCAKGKCMHACVRTCIRSYTKHNKFMCKNWECESSPGQGNMNSERSYFHIATDEDGSRGRETV